MTIRILNELGIVITTGLFLDAQRFIRLVKN